MFLNVPNRPLSKFINPVCSLCSLLVCKEFKARYGTEDLRENAWSTRVLPSVINPVLDRILSAMLFVASKNRVEVVVYKQLFITVLQNVWMHLPTDKILS